MENDKISSISSGNTQTPLPRFEGNRETETGATGASDKGVWPRLGKESDDEHMVAEPETITDIYMKDKEETEEAEGNRETEVGVGFAGVRKADNESEGDRHSEEGRSWDRESKEESKGELDITVKHCGDVVVTGEEPGGDRVMEDKPERGKEGEETEGGPSGVRENGDESERVRHSGSESDRELEEGPAGDRETKEESGVEFETEVGDRNTEDESEGVGEVGDVSEGKREISPYEDKEKWDGSDSVKCIVSEEDRVTEEEFNGVRETKAGPGGDIEIDNDFKGNVYKNARECTGTESEHNGSKRDRETMDNSKGVLKTEVRPGGDALMGDEPGGDVDTDKTERVRYIEDESEGGRERIDEGGREKEDGSDRVGHTVSERDGETEERPFGDRETKDESDEESVAKGGLVRDKDMEGGPKGFKETEARECTVTESGEMLMNLKEDREVEVTLNYGEDKNKSSPWEDVLKSECVSREVLPNKDSELLAEKIGNDIFNYEVLVEGMNTENILYLDEVTEGEVILGVKADHVTLIKTPISKTVVAAKYKEASRALGCTTPKTKFRKWSRENYENFSMAFHVWASVEGFPLNADGSKPAQPLTVKHMEKIIEFGGPNLLKLLPAGLDPLRIFSVRYKNGAKNSYHYCGDPVSGFTRLYGLHSQRTSCPFYHCLTVKVCIVIDFKL